MSILFSSHITSDLDKCADDITYIRDGDILASMDIEQFKDRYRKVSGRECDLSDKLRKALIGCRLHGGRFQAVAEAGQLQELVSDSGANQRDGLENQSCDPVNQIQVGQATLEDIMIHMEKE